MMIFAIGDVHGMLSQLEKAFARIEQEVKNRGNPDHLIVMLGDYVDRGPDSEGCIEFLMKQPSNVICLMGNHEELMMNSDDFATARCWMNNGGIQTLNSYALQDGEPGRRDDIPASHIEWMKNLPLSFDDGRRIFVHAGINPRKSFSNRGDEVMWIRDPFLEHFEKFEKYVVHGHTPYAHDPFMKKRGHIRTNLDSGCFYSGKLTIAIFDDTQDEPRELIKIGGKIAPGYS